MSQDPQCTRRELGEKAYLTHRIKTPRGEKECVTVLYDECAPETFAIVLRENITIEVQSICSYPNLYRINVPFHQRHICFMNFPARYAPCEVAEFVACPWKEKESPTQSSSDSEITGWDDYLKTITRFNKDDGTTSKNSQAEWPRDPKHIKAISQLQPAFNKFHKIFAEAFAACETPIPPANFISGILALLKSEATEDRFKGFASTHDLPQQIDRFVTWAKGQRVSTLTTMLRNFPFGLEIPRDLGKERVDAKMAQLLFWPWQACFTQMEIDAKQDRITSRDDFIKPPFVDLENIKTIIRFPDGCIAYGRAMQWRKPDDEEKHHANLYALRGKENLPPPPDEGNEKLLTTMEVAKRLQISDRQVRNLVAKNVFVPVRGLGRKVRFIWADVIDSLRKCAYKISGQ